MPSELVTIASYGTPIEAHAAKNYLESNGVQAFLADENYSRLQYGLLISTKLQVAASDTERAKQLLEAAKA